MPPLNPDLMTAEKRIAELGGILAHGFVRLRALRRLRGRAKRSWRCGQTVTGRAMTDTTVPARIAALRRMPTAELEAQWTLLFDAPPPPHDRRFLESRLIYRIQELAYGGLAPETVK